MLQDQKILEHLQNSVLQWTPGKKIKKKKTLTDTLASDPYC